MNPFREFTYRRNADSAMCAIPGTPVSEVRQHGGPWEPPQGPPYWAWTRHGSDRLPVNTKNYATAVRTLEQRVSHPIGRVFVGPMRARLECMCDRCHVTMDGLFMRFAIYVSFDSQPLLLACGATRGAIDRGRPRAPWGRAARCDHVAQISIPVHAYARGTRVRSVTPAGKSEIKETPALGNQALRGSTTSPN